MYESESGHALEFDDTKDNERVHLYHRAGSYMEYGPDGSLVERVERDKFSVVVGDECPSQRKREYNDNGNANVLEKVHII